MWGGAAEGVLLPDHVQERPAVGVQLAEDVGEQLLRHVPASDPLAALVQGGEGGGPSIERHPHRGSAPA